MESETQVSQRSKQEFIRAKLQDILKTEAPVKRNAIELLNRKLVEEFREFYGEYPHYNTDRDSTVERLHWALFTI